MWHWLIVGVVLLLMFGGRGKISEMMGDVAKGIKAFKRGMSEDETPPPAQASAPKIEQDQTKTETRSSTETGTKV